MTSPAPVQLRLGSLDVALADDGVIRQGRARIESLDVDPLEAQVRECYETVQSNLERLIGRAPGAP